MRVTAVTPMGSWVRNFGAGAPIYSRGAAPFAGRGGGGRSCHNLNNKLAERRVEENPCRLDLLSRRMIDGAGGGQFGGEPVQIHPVCIPCDREETDNEDSDGVKPHDDDEVDHREVMNDGGID